MEKEEFKPIIECASKTMMRCLTIATECAIELVKNEDINYATQNFRYSQ